MSEANKLSETQEAIANRIAVHVCNILFGEDYKKYKFTDRLQKAFVEKSDLWIFLSSWVIVIYGMVYIGLSNLVALIIGLYIGFYVLFRILFEVITAIFIDEKIQGL